MRLIGFSTGALARGDFRRALDILHRRNLRAVELSALRFDELEPLVDALPDLDLHAFDFVSVHAPSRFAPNLETTVLSLLHRVARFGLPIMVHPDVIYNAEKWQSLGNNLLIENMDKRKPIGRTRHELEPIFDALPAARFCFDIGHVRQVDPTMTEAVLMLRAFGDRLGEVHISEVNTASRHDPISLNAVHAFSAVAARIPETVPIILETLLDQGQSDIDAEITRARQALTIPQNAFHVRRPVPTP